MLTNPITEPVLVVEDDPNDALLLKIALQKNGLDGNIHFVSDGQEAMDYLSGIPPYDDRQKHPFPSLIYTDLKMPRQDGFEVLKWLNDRPDCSVIPIIVLSASAEDRDIKKAYQLGANAYLVKPSTINQLTEMLHTCMRFWGICQKPAGPAKC
ncbi:MAG: response regulator receiver protein [Pedosphaera sp.]|nr:response regulator receiver protein [Pedosphaera sp.]